MNRYRSLIVFALVAAGALAALWVWRGAGDADREAATTPAQARQWRLSYRQSGTRHAHPSIPGAPAADLAVAFELAGALVLQPQGPALGPRQDYRFALHIDAWKGEHMGQFDQIDRDRIDGVVTLVNGTHVEAFHLRDGDFDALAPVLVDVFALLDATIERDTVSWHSAETAHDRTFAAQWTRIDSSTFHKSARVEEPELSYGFTGQYVVPDDSAWVSVDVQRERTFRFRGAPVSRDRTVLELRSQTGAVAPLAALALRDLRREDVRGSTSRADQQRRIYEQMLGGVGVPELLAALGTIDSPSMNDSVDVYQQLKAFFHLHPDKLADFARACTQGGSQSVGCGHVMTAATAAGSAESQAFLRTLYEQLEGDAHGQNQVLPHLSMTETPSAETVAFLRAVADSGRDRLGSTARLALGTAAHQLRDDDPAAAAAIYGEAVARLGDARDDDARARSLRVLGNIGMPDQFDVIAPYLTHQNPEVRASAVAALRHVDSDEAREALLGAVLGDPVVRIREVAAESLRFTPVGDEHIVQIARHVWGETNLTVIKHLAHVVVEQGGKTEAEVSFREYVEACGHPDLCGYLEQLVESRWM